MWNTVLFDLDGTITDSAEGITRCVQYALKKGFGIEAEDLHELECFVGPPLKEQFMKYADLTADQAEEAVRIYRERYTSQGMFENRVYDGVREMLEDLNAEHFTVALCSSKPTVFCRQILEYFDIGKYFSLVVGAELDGTRTKKTDVVEAVLEKTGMRLRRDEAVLVGDRCYDIEGAKESGISSIGVTYGYGSLDELENEDPDSICTSPIEVRNVLIGQARSAEIQTEPDLPPYMIRGKKDGRIIDARVTAAVLESDGSVFRRIWRCIYPFLIDIGLSTVISIVCVFLIQTFCSLIGKFAGPDDIYRQTVIITGITDAAMLPLFWFLMKQDDSMRRNAGAAHFRILRKEEALPEKVLKVALTAIVMSGALELVIGLIPIYDPEYEAVAEAISLPHPLIQLIAVGIIGPILEEVLFRGLIYRRLRDYLGVFWAIILSSAIFGIAHGNVTQGLYAGLFGIILALYYEHYGSLWAPCAAHMANNIFSLVSVYLVKILPDGVWLVLYLAGFVVIVHMFRKVYNLKESANVV